MDYDRLSLFCFLDYKIAPTKSMNLQPLPFFIIIIIIYFCRIILFFSRENYATVPHTHSFSRGRSRRNRRTPPTLGLGARNPTGQSIWAWIRFAINGLILKAQLLIVRCSLGIWTKIGLYEARITYLNKFFFRHI